LFSSTSQTDNAGLALYELPKSSASFTDIALNESFNFGSVQWVSGGLVVDAVSVGHRGEATVHQVAISGSNGTVSGTTSLWSRRNRQIEGPAQYWVQNGTIISPYYYGGLALWRYPKGGRPTKIIGAPNGFFGVTVSVARHR
jgi:hypothetical protein